MAVSLANEVSIRLDFLFTKPEKLEGKPSTVSHLPCTSSRCHDKSTRIKQVIFGKSSCNPLLKFS